MQVATPRLAAVGDREIDFRRIFAEAVTATMRPFFVENDAAPQGDSLANAARSHRNLAALLARG